MDPFLVAQADDPFDPAPMLIQADWLEEVGDPISASVLRGLAESGTPSLQALALEATLYPMSPNLDQFKSEHGDGDDDDGFKFWYRPRCGEGAGGVEGFWYGNEDRNGHGVGIGDGHGFESGSPDG